MPSTFLWESQKEKAQDAFDAIKRTYEEISVLNLGPGEEAGLEDKFIRPVLKLLGYEWDVQPITERGAKKKRPDYALFKDKTSLETSRKEKAHLTYFFKHPLTILEAKYWGRRLNDADTKDTLDRRDPTAQTVKYLDNVYYASESRIQWAILTNGKHWRLFYYRASSRSGNFFEIDLEEIIKRGSVDDFLYFYLFFSRDAFVKDPATDRTWLDQHLKGSEEYAERVSAKLKDLIFDKVFEGLAEGFVHYKKVELSATGETIENRKEIFKGCLTLLYRLLFLLYAESRNLLPTEEDGYFRVSLKKLKEDIYKDLSAIGFNRMSKRSYGYWARLASLFDIIAKGDPALNVPIYNGGLFETSDSSFLSVHKMPDPFLAEAIEHLTIDREGDYRPGTIPFIDYSSLSVRHLGDIYEGLLEFHVQIADAETVEVKEKGKSLWKKVSEVETGTKTYRKKAEGEVYIENSKHERKATGSYYTPHYIVEYIVKNTVGSVLEERLETAKKLLSELENANKALKRQTSTDGIRGYKNKIKGLEDSIFNTIFDIKVLDPAMGSGHFLVHTVDFISDRIITFLADYPDNPVIRKIDEMRNEILKEIERQGVRIDEGKLTEVNLIKRMVMKRVIYGVDLNDMAVELAKLSLWLDSFTLGAPLSFLDHHLKCGNSLIGVLDISSIIVPKILDTSSDDIVKFTDTESFAKVKRTLSFVTQVSELTDATITEAKKSNELFNSAQKEVEPIRRRLDVATAKHFMDMGESYSRVDQLAYTLEYEKETYPEIVEKCKKALQVAKEKMFFHWRIEFPEVFYTERGEKENPGFDCVIGNPPYVNVENIPKENRDYLLHISKLVKGRFDIYIPFIGQGYELLSNSGVFGFIIPYPFLYERYGEPVRDLLLQNGSPLHIVNLSGWKVFPDATVRNILLFFGKGGCPSEITVLNQEEDPWLHGIKGHLNHIPSALLSKIPYKMFRLEINDAYSHLKDKIGGRSVRLGQICYTNWGARSGNIKKYVVDNGQIKDAKPMLDGEDVRRYSITPRKKFLLYRPEELYNPMFPELFENTKLIIPDVTGKNGVQASLDTNGFYTEHTVSLVVPKYLLRNVTSRKIKISQGDENLSEKYNLAFCLSIINSSLNRWYFTSFIGGQLHTYPDDIKSFPIPRISFTTPEKERKKRVSEAIRLYQTEINTIALNADKWQNKEKGDKDDEGRDKKGSTRFQGVAEKPRRYKVPAEGVSEEGSGLGSEVHGVREGASEYKPSEGTPKEGQDSTRPLNSTRYFETAQGIKTYSEVSEILAVSVAKTIEAIIETSPEDIYFTSEWICKLHNDIAGSLFPDWAGRFRDVNVKVGTHTPPPFYEAPVLVRLYCEDLAVRLSFASKEKDIEKISETLAYADWRFQWIHPFRDFNGRVGRILLTAILFKLRLPPAETASVEPEEKERYLNALHEADTGNLLQLIEIWVKRLSKAFKEKEK